MQVAYCKTAGAAAPRWVRPQRHHGADGWMGKPTPQKIKYKKRTSRGGGHRWRFFSGSKFKPKIHPSTQPSEASRLAF